MERLAALLFAEDLLKDPRYVDPAYFTGIHEMGHALDMSGNMASGQNLLDVTQRLYHENNPQDPPWQPGDPPREYTPWHPDGPMAHWMRRQLPKAAFDKDGFPYGPEMIAHAFTEMKLNPQGAGPLARGLYDHLLKNTPQNGSHGGLSVGPGVPSPLQWAIEDVQHEHPSADLARVDLTPEDSLGPAWVERTDANSTEPPRMRMDQQYANPATPTKFTDWFDDAIDGGYFPRWESTTAREPWPEDAIEDMDTEFDQPKTAALLFGAIFPNYDEGREHLEPDDPYVADPVPSGATWYHVSPSPMKPGDRLRPFGGERPYGKMYDAHPQFKHRDQHVWTEHDPYVSEAKWANDAKPYIYEITPDEAPLPWNGTGSEGWVTPGATIKREISHTGWLPQVDFTDAGRTASIFADPDGRGVWKTAADGRVEFLAAPHAR